MHFMHFCQLKYCEGEAKLGGCLVWRRAELPSALCEVETVT